MQNNEIVIIGSGIAGLAAANYLSKHGIHSTVLEARARVGGRIWPDKTLGVPIARGAAWIHGIEGNPLYELLQQTPDSFFTVDPSEFYFYDKAGKRISSDIVDKFNENFATELDRIKKIAFSLDDDLSLEDSLSKIFDFCTATTSIEKELLLGKLNYFENYIGAHYKHLSSRYWDAEETIPGAHGIFADAYEGVIDYLSNGCNIQLNTVVESIDMRSDVVHLKTSRGEIFASKVIVTVPLGVLKSNDILFTPQLPTEKNDAIDRLGMGLFNIICMRFPYSFWEDNCHAFFLPEQGSCSTFFNIGRFLGAPIILGYVGGDTARQLEEHSDQEIIGKIIQALQKYFKKEIPQPDQFFITRWLSDPYSRGSYSYYQVGASCEDRDALAEPIEDKIYFAGEATHNQYPATTHGAYLSGIREAKRIIAELNQKK